MIGDNECARPDKNSDLEFCAWSGACLCAIQNQNRQKTQFPVFPTTSPEILLTLILIGSIAETAGSLDMYLYGLFANVEGIGSPCFFRLDKYPDMASLAFATASCLVFPWDMHPGRSGTSETNPVFVLPYEHSFCFSMVIDFMHNRFRSRIITNKFISFRSIVHKV